MGLVFWLLIDEARYFRSDYVNIRIILYCFASLLLPLNASFKWVTMKNLISVLMKVLCHYFKLKDVGNSVVTGRCLLVWHRSECRQVDVTFSECGGLFSDLLRLHKQCCCHKSAACKYLENCQRRSIIGTLT